VKPTDPTHSQHPDELLLAYLENELAPEQKLEIDQHVSHCERCSSEIEKLVKITAALKSNKEAFCPDSSEIYQYIRTGDTQEGRISRHLEACPTCFAFAEALRTEASPETMPQAVWKQLQERFEIKDVQHRAVPVQTEPGFAERLRDWFRLPMLTAGAVAATILLVVVLYPREFTIPNVGLSTVTWEGVPKPKAIRTRAAFLVTFKDIREPLPQKQIDEIYRALKPDMDLSQKFEIIPPAELRTAAKSGDVVINSQRIRETAESLHKKLDISRVAVITLEPSDGKYSANVQLMDAASGAALNQKTESAVPETQLPERIREMVLGLMH
jgi:hypothetical protein